MVPQIIKKIHHSELRYEVGAAELLQETQS